MHLWDWLSRASLFFWDRLFVHWILLHMIQSACGSNHLLQVNIHKQGLSWCVRRHLVQRDWQKTFKQCSATVANLGNTSRVSNLHLSVFDHAAYIHISHGKYKPASAFVSFLTSCWSVQYCMLV